MLSHLEQGQLMLLRLNWLDLLKYLCAELSYKIKKTIKVQKIIDQVKIHYNFKIGDTLKFEISLRSGE